MLTVIFVVASCEKPSCEKCDKMVWEKSKSNVWADWRHGDPMEPKARRAMK